MRTSKTQPEVWAGVPVEEWLSRGRGYTVASGGQGMGWVISDPEVPPGLCVPVYERESWASCPELWSLLGPGEGGTGRRGVLGSPEEEG